MRLKKGNNVEVMNKNDFPVSSGLDKCINGDIVEVFSECTWKLASILRVLKDRKEIKSKNVFRNRYLVRILGCSEELIVDESNIRTRRILHDDKWSLIGKSCEDVVASNPATSTYYHHKTNVQIPQIKSRAEKKPRYDYTNDQNKTAFLESENIFHSRSLKRMTPYGSSIVEAHNGHAKKIRAIEKGGSTLRGLDNQNTHAFVYNISTGRYNQTKRTKPDINCSDSDACSVGSCSVTGRTRNNFFIPITPFACRETDTVCSDAESCYESRSERKRRSYPPEEELEGSIRRLELHAYRRTLEALYACGPLSWEREEMLTNLRIMLRISNDEHLMELKNLISAKNAINYR